MSLVLDASYFDAIYQQSDDPWSFSSRWYESRKYDVIMATLPRKRYDRAFEPGCSIGVLSARLAERCDTVIATDISHRAVELSREKAPSNVEVRQLAIPDGWPEGSFDLIVLSDVCHYFDPSGLRQVFQRSRDALRPRGSLVAAHWRHPVPEYPSNGDDVHTALHVVSGLTQTATHVEADFRLEVRIRNLDQIPAENLSVAAEEGWLHS